MHYALVLATLAVLSPLPALAQDKSDTKPPKLPETCQELSGELGNTLELSPQSVVEETGSGCTISNFHVSFGVMDRFHVEKATLSASDLFGSFAEQRLPEELDLQLDQVITAPDTGSPQTDYMIEAMNEPMDIHLAYRWDREEQTVELADFSVSAQGIGGVRFGGRFSDLELDPAKLADATTLPTRIDQLVIEIDNARYLSAMVVPIVIGSLPYDEDPRASVANYIAAATAFINSVPSDTMEDDSKAALVTFVEGFPRIRGDYTLDIRAEPGLGFEDLDVDDPAELAGLLPRIKAEASYTPDEP
nr:hypothetical protein [uncultured Devosia sp.]